MIANDRALVDWRKAAGSVETAELQALFAQQTQPSPTDIAETRVLRYQLAAITRREIESRGEALPTAATTTVAQDQSASARRARSADLARLWRAGESAALFAEPELAGALDLFAAAERSAGAISEEKLAAVLTALHGDLAKCLEAGEHPSPANVRSSGAGDRSYIVQPGRRDADR